jgi:hypothetical protein
MDTHFTDEHLWTSYSSAVPLQSKAGSVIRENQRARCPRGGNACFAAEGTHEDDSLRYMAKGKATPEFWNMRIVQIY